MLRVAPVSDLDSDVDVDPEGDGTASLLPKRGRPDEMSGEYRDPVNFGLLSAGLGIGGIFFVIYWQAGAFSLGPGLAIFALLFPLAGLYAAYLALNVAILGFDRSGWRYRREFFGHSLETEEGRWSDIAQTSYRQWAKGGTRTSNSLTLFGELSLWDSSGKAVLKARTCFFERGNPGANHVPGKRQIGLTEPDFGTFVRLINDETPQLGYEWVAHVVNNWTPRNWFVYVDPGPDRYVQVPRGARAPIDANAGYDRGSDPLPTPF
jgi:hypothetical protein